MLRAPWQVKFTVNEILFDNLILKKRGDERIHPPITLDYEKN